MGEKFWANEEDKDKLVSILGTEAFDYLMLLASKNALSDFISPPPSYSGLNQKLCDVVESSNWNYAIYWQLCDVVESSNWNYAIYWQVSSLKSGGSSLIWGDGHCRDLKHGGVGDASGSVDGSVCTFSPDSLGGKARGIAGLYGFSSVPTIAALEGSDGGGQGGRAAATTTFSLEDLFFLDSQEVKAKPWRDCDCDCKSNWDSSNIIFICDSGVIRALFHCCHPQLMFLSKLKK